jgi:excisionase family DNA binding protein
VGAGVAPGKSKTSKGRRWTRGLLGRLEGAGLTPLHDRSPPASGRLVGELTGRFAMEERLTIAEAAKRYSVSPSAIRRLIEAGRLKSTKDGDGRHQLDTGDLAGAMTRRSPTSRIGAVTGKTSPDRSGEVVGELSPTAERYMRSLESALEHERRVCEDVRAQNRELQSQLVKLTAEMQAILSKEGDGMLSRWFRK